ncbi:uncharacterized protein BO97DRAFT_443164, partial [Aspergillus homomorphus CBS 101889]
MSTTTSSSSSPQAPKQSKKAKKQQKQQKKSQNPSSAPKESAKVLLADTIGKALHERLLSFGARRHHNPQQQQEHHDWDTHLDSRLLSASPYLTVPHIPRTSSSSSSSSISRGSSSITLSSCDGRSVASSRTSHESNPIDKPYMSSVSLHSDVLTSRIVTLNGPCTMETIQHLVSRYGQVSHMGVLDPSYSLFVNRSRTAVLCFKVLNKVAVVSGDPMCAAEQFGPLLSEFQTYRKSRRLGIAFLGTSERMVHYAHRTQSLHAKQNWTLLEFAKERVLNPTTNAVLLEQSGKRIVMQNKQLLNPSKGGITLDVYVPPERSSSSSVSVSTEGEPSSSSEDLQSQLHAIYTNWCDHRNTTATTTTT